MAIGLAVMLATPSLPRAQSPGGDSRPFKPEELEQIVAPIALYPDPLIAQIFMASTYPLEVIQAGQFAKASQNLKDAALNEELKKQNWDDSVKSLVSFPPVLEMMNSQLAWMQKLGDAVLSQKKDTMDAIQRLRMKAQSAGNLRSTEQQKVIVDQAEPPQQQTIIKIEPANPQVVHVPTYNPEIVYGPRPYPYYPPYDYYPPYYPDGYLATAAIAFGVGMIVGDAIWGGCNWGRSDIDIDVNRRNNFNRNVNRGDRVSPRTADRAGGARGDRASWQHNPEHRKGAQLEAATFGFGAFQPLSLLEKPGASKIVFSLGIDAGQAHLDRGKLVLPDRAIEKLVVPGVGVREPARAVGHERDRKWEVVVPDDRDSATQQKFNRGTDSARAASRESFRGRAEQGRRELARGGAGQGAARSREGGFGSAGGAQRAGGVGQGGAGSGRGEGALGSGGGQRGGQVGTGGGRAFEGAGQGQRHRSYTERGQSSRGSSSYSSSGGSRGGGGFSGDGGGRGGGGRDRGGGRR